MADKIDGDTVHLLDSYMETALRSACEFVALNQPPNHEALLTVQTQNWAAIINAPVGQDYDYFDLSNFTFEVVKAKKFHLVTYENVAGRIVRCHNANSYRSLSATPLHDVVYYYVEGNKLFVNTAIADEGTPAIIMVEHYIYADITTYPDELDQYLIAELIKIASNEINKQEMEKNEV